MVVGGERSIADEVSEHFEGDVDVVFPSAVVFNGLLKIQLLQERLSNQAMAIFETLADYLGTAQYGHEIGIAVPSWNEVEVDMFVDPRSRHLAKIESCVVTLRIYQIIKRFYRKLKDMHHFRKLFGRQGFETVQVPVWNYHQVAVVIWELIQDNEAEFTPVNDVIFRIHACFTGQPVTENTSFFLPGCPQEILFPPWRPHPIHLHSPCSLHQNYLYSAVVISPGQTAEVDSGSGLGS